MKRILFLATFFVASLAIHAADAKDEVLAAAKKLAEQPNYSWKSTSTTPTASQFRPGPVNGKADKDGTVYVTLEMRDNLVEAVMKGGKGAITNQDGDWESMSDLEKAEGPGRFRAGMLRNMKAPAVQAVDLAKGASELKKDGDAIAGDLTADGAKEFMRFGRGNGPEIKNAAGSVKYWLKDGSLAKYEYKVKGTIIFNGEDRDVDRTTTVEISNVGATKLTVPESAAKKML